MSSLDHPAVHTPQARPPRKWPLLMRVSEVAFELGLSRRRIYQLMHAGELESVKIGKASRVPSASVRKLAGERDPE
jgi:excisionase family DNA binding protein